jgi:hypothetical protein
LLLQFGKIIRAYINKLERAPRKQSIHNFHVTISNMLNKHVPPPDPLESKERPTKRSCMESADSLVLFVQGMPEHLALQVLKHARENDVPIQARDNNPRHAHTNPRPFATGRMTQKCPAWWMCCNCNELDHDHTECTKPTVPKAEKRFQDNVREHKAKEAQCAKSKERNAAQTNNKPVQSNSTPKLDGKKALTC